MMVSFVLALLLAQASQARAFRVEVVVSPAIESAAVDGRVLLLFSSKGEGEPRFHVVNRASAEPFFGIDVLELNPGSPAAFDDSVLGYPVESLRGWGPAALIH